MVVSIGEKIRELRRSRGMTQEELGDRLFVKKSTISMYEHDEIDIKSSVIVELADILKMRPGYFFGDSGVSEKDATEVIISIRDIVDDFLLSAG